MFLLRVNVFQYGLELTRAHRKRAIPTLPEKAAIASIECLDPFGEDTFFICSIN